jgi:NAD(P)H-dependent FMN reductase
MKVAIIYGSNRSDRQGIKAAKFIRNKLSDKAYEVSLIDSKEYDFPLLDKMYKEYDSGKAPEYMEKVHQIFEDADGFVIVSGEYNHSVSAALKNVLDHFQSEYYFKPSAIVSYSAGSFGGLRAAVHLRAILAELGMPSIPSIFPISNIYNSIGPEGEALEQKYDKRINRFIDEFDWYLNAFKNQREKGTPG